MSINKLSLEQLNRLSVEAFKETPKSNFVFILDDIRSMNNVGSVFRTGDAFLIEKIYLCGITAQPPHREITKTAIGADESVAWEYAPDAAVLVGDLQSQGYIVVAVEQTDGGVMLQDIVFETGLKYAFVLGNEVFGVSESVVELADFCVEVPQFGTKHSLNVSVTAGIVAWDYVSKCMKNNVLSQPPRP